MNPPAVSSVVVTGMGLVSPLGLSVEVSWRNLLDGKTARHPISLFDVSGCRCHEGAEIVERLPMESHSLPRASVLAITAVREALGQAGLLDGREKSLVADMPMSVSTTGGGMSFGEEFLRRTLAGKKYSRLRYAARYQPQQQALDIQQAFGIAGATTIIANACASGANAIGHGADLIRAGKASCVLAGGFDAMAELIFVGFDCLQALSPDCCRPFDRNRNGLMLGEGAAFLILEEEASARQRGAEILCHVTGYGHTTDLHHLTQPHPEGHALVGAMRMALGQANVPAAAIGYLNSHGTATPMNDGAEVNAYLQVFGDELPVVSATKAAIGHTLGAAGAIEAVFAIQALREGVPPPELNTLDPIPEIGRYLAKAGQTLANPEHVMSVNLGFGGSNAALVFSKSGPGSSVVESSGFRVAVAGMGAVSPRGCGVDRLFSDELPALSRVELLSDTSQSVPVFAVPVADENLTKWRKHPRLRRASPLSIFMAEAASQAVATLSDAEKARTGIVAAFSTGSNIFSRRFFTDVIQQGQSFASPALFPETVFNSPTSHIASILGITGACYSIVGDDTAWCEALKVAALWLDSGLVDHALVIGAEELDAITLEAFVASGWLSASGGADGFIPSEGAGAMLLNRSSAPALEIPGRMWPYRSPAQAREAIAECLDGRSTLPISARSWIAELCEGERSANYLGEAFTASASWETLRALQKGGSGTLLIPGLNQAVGRLDLLRGA